MDYYLHKRQRPTVHEKGISHRKTHLIFYFDLYVLVKNGLVPSKDN
jgi:hypothetical protein